MFVKIDLGAWNVHWRLRKIFVKSAAKNWSDAKCSFLNGDRRQQTSTCWQCYNTKNGKILGKTSKIFIFSEDFGGKKFSIRHFSKKFSVFGVLIYPPGTATFSRQKCSHGYFMLFDASNMDVLNILLWNDDIVLGELSVIERRMIRRVLKMQSVVWSNGNKKL